MKKNKDKIYIDVEINEEPMQKMIKYFEEIDTKAKELIYDGVSKRNVNKIIKKCLKIKK